MTLKQIKLIAQKSFIKNELDYKKVKIFTSKMKRKELREYIREIKSLDSKMKVRIVVPNLKTFEKKDISSLLKKYQDKKILYEEDQSLLVGLKVIDNDLIYDFNLKNSLEELVRIYD